MKEAELRELLAAPEGFGDDVPVDPNFDARRLPDIVWREPGSRFSGGVDAVIQLHRLREVMALIGFTSFEAAVRDINGDYESDVERAAIALEPSWYPAVENRGDRWPLADGVDPPIDDQRPLRTPNEALHSQEADDAHSLRNRSRRMFSGLPMIQHYLCHRVSLCWLPCMK